MHSPQRLSLSLFAVAFLSSVSVFGDVYLSIPGVQGESVDQSHEGWVACESVQFGIERTSDERLPVFTGLTLTRPVDASSPALFLKAASGTVDSVITVEISDSVGDVYMAIQLRKANVAEYSTSIADGGEAVETIRLRFSHITLAMYPRDSRTGELLNPVVRGWNVSTGVRDDTWVK